MELSISFIITIFLIGFIGSYISGMVGIGGSIIKYPMLLYIPPLFGLAAFTAHEVSGISAVQVFFATIGGVWAYRKGGYLNKMLIIYMGSAILLGSFIGGFGSKMMSEGGINLIYGILALIAAIMMFIPNKGVDDIPLDQVKFNKWLAASLALVVGIGAGIDRGGRGVPARSDHAGCIENTDANDHCVLARNHLHLIHRFYGREADDGTSGLYPGPYYGCCQLDRFSTGSGRG